MVTSRCLSTFVLFFILVGLSVACGGSDTTAQTVPGGGNSGSNTSDEGATDGGGVSSTGGSDSGAPSGGEEDDGAELPIDSEPYACGGHFGSTSQCNGTLCVDEDGAESCPDASSARVSYVGGSPEECESFFICEDGFEKMPPEYSRCGCGCLGTELLELVCAN